MQTKKRKKLLIVIPSSIILLFLIGIFIQYKVKLNELKKEVDEFESIYLEKGYTFKKRYDGSTIIFKDNILLDTGAIFILNSGYGIEDYLEIDQLAINYYRDEYYKFIKVVKSIAIASGDGFNGSIFTEDLHCVGDVTKTVCMLPKNNGEIVVNHVEGVKLIKEQQEEYKLFSKEILTYVSSKNWSKYNNQRINYDFAKKDLTYFLFNKYKDDII